MNWDKTTIKTTGGAGGFERMLMLFHFHALNEQIGHQAAGDVGVFQGFAFLHHQFIGVGVDGAGEDIPFA